ncbi:uncharacterized protein [Triticum aestivum]|uniref:uncharacterized protein isoform X1 n=1 Tax=Triticum aestivum TaxID=4565 RepID=UPI001D0089D6|nr:uncharacterized protein LOC123102844 isoform X1 [Triticum aestivum]
MRNDSLVIDRESDRFRPRSSFPLFPFYFLAFFLFWKAQPSAFSLSPLHPLLHCSCPAAPSSARRLTSAARSAREARPHELREGGGQYGEAPCPHERREVKVQRRPIRGGAATARAPRGPGAEAANTASGACPATIQPPRRARPCSYASYPGWTSPRALSPPASPSSPTASAIPVASEDFQINTEAPCRSQHLAKYNTTTRLTPRLPAVHSVLPSTILQPERGLRTFSKTGTL